MKYFSPNILDGSVTTAKLADRAVTSIKLGLNAVRRASLNTSTTGQGGSIPSSLSVLVLMSPYTFFMDTEMEDGLTADLTPAEVATPAANADAPQFNINNNIAAAKLYDVEWRHVNV